MSYGGQPGGYGGGGGGGGRGKSRGGTLQGGRGGIWEGANANLTPIPLMFKSAMPPPRAQATPAKVPQERRQ